MNTIKQRSSALAVMLALMMILSSCGDSAITEPDEPSSPDVSPDPVPGQAEYIRITPEEAKEMMIDGVVILDVRTQEEFDRLRLANAILLPDFDVREQAENVLTDKDQVILVYCRAGRRSEIAAKILIELGYTRVYDFGGLNDWRGEVLRNGRLETARFSLFDSDYIVEPFTFTTFQRVHDDLPEFEFRVDGNRVIEFDLQTYEPVHWTSDSIRVHTLTVTSPDGRLNQVFEILYADNHLVTAESPGLSFDDYNFDGYLDISLWYGIGGTARNVPTYYWLWDNDAFEFAACEKLGRLNNVAIDAEAQQIIEYMANGAWNRITCYHEYIDGILTVVKSVEVWHKTGDEEHDANTLQWIMDELGDGEIVITDKYYEVTRHGQ
jgi:rhodanese-related sulfurtransferase